MNILRFTVPGEPHPKYRARSGVIKRKGCDGTDRKHYRAVTFDDKRNKEESDRIWPHCIRAMHEARVDRWSGPVALYVIACFMLPKSISNAERIRRFWHTQTPDLDNVIKVVADALNGVAWGDDCAVVHGMQQKTWSSTWEGYEVWIAMLPESPADAPQAFRDLRVLDGQFLDRVEQLAFAGRAKGDGATLSLGGV